MKTHRIKSIILIVGDLAIFYLGLAITLLLRYDISEFEKWWNLHLLPFSILFATWIIIFMIAGLYDPLSFSARQQIREKVMRTMLFAGTISIIIFYVWSQATITPKTNLVINVAVSIILLMAWRKLFGILLAKSDKTRVMFLGWSPETEKLAEFLKNDPHLGYTPAAFVLPAETQEQPETQIPTFAFDQDLPKIIRENQINLVVASLDIHANTDLIKMLYEVLPLGVAYLGFPQFYEHITGKIPISMISEVWFLENLTESEKRIFKTIKRAFDVLAGSILGILAILVFPVVALAIKIGSPGPVFFRQKRVGRNGKIFELIKFRSQIHDGQDINSGWSKEDNKKRITLVGKIIRKTYIDEFPQALNIIRGDMSLIGPRPERQEFVEELKKEIPHYMMRLLVQPGISGWAQINMEYDASAKDALEKLQYDLYYVKNRSIGLDISIALKTLFTMISRSGK